MGRFSRDEVLRVARLCRLRLSDEELARLPSELDAIAAAFSDLAAHADGLPDAPPPQPAPPREDAPILSSQEEADAILRASPHADSAARLLRGPRGSP